MSARQSQHQLQAHRWQVMWLHPLALIVGAPQRGHARLTLLTIASDIFSRRRCSRTNAAQEVPRCALAWKKQKSPSCAAP